MSSVERAVDLDVATLRGFVALVEDGRFGAAATRLGVDQSTLSRRIRRLESQLGVRLVQRGANGAVPTESGETLLPRARRLIGAAEVFAETATNAASDRLDR